MVHRQTEDTVSHPVRVRKILRSRAVKSPICRECADEWIEVSAAEDIPLPHAEVHFVPRHAVSVSIDEDREVGIIVLHSWHVIEVCDPLHSFQCFKIPYGNPASGFYSLVDLLQVQESVRRPYLVHLAVDPRCDDRDLVGKPEVLQVVYPLLGLSVVHDKGTTLYSVVHFRGVETEGGQVSFIEYAPAVDLHPECMCGIIYDLQSVLVRYLLYLGCTARLAIDMDRHDGSGLGSYGRLYIVRIDVTGCWIYIHKYRLYPVPPQGMCSGHETVGCSYHLPGYPQGLESRDQG